MDASLSAAYATELLRPQVEVTVKQAAPLQIFVAGQVKTPGVYVMPGDINALQGVVLAGDFLPGARRDEVVVIRRGADGRPMMRVVDLRRAIYRPGGSDAVPLRRFDIVYVPKTALQAIGDVVTEIRNALPVQFSYVIGGSYVSN
jgi:polysaccharide export outer membrane protein